MWLKSNCNLRYQSKKLELIWLFSPRKRLVSVRAGQSQDVFASFPGLVEALYVQFNVTYSMCKALC